MSDVQILRTALSSNFALYTVPGAAEMRIKAVYAEFRNVSAAFNWTPVIEILSDSGHSIAIAVDPSVLVSAGDDADVSWFPSLRSGGTAAGAAAPDYLLLTGAGQTVIRPPVGDSDHAKFSFASRQTNVDSTWTYILDGAGDIKEVDTTVPGRYQSICHFVWGDPVAASTLQVSAHVFGAGPINVSTDASINTADDWDDYVQVFTNLPSGTAQFQIEPAIPNGDASIAFDAVHWWILRYRT